MKQKLPPTKDKTGSQKYTVHQVGLFNATSVKPHTNVQSPTHGNQEKSNSKYWWKFVIPLLVFVIGTGLVYYLGWTNGPSSNDSSSKVKGLGTGLLPPPTITPISTPIPVNFCGDADFLEQFWNTSSYDQDTDGYYLPNDQSRQIFLYPPLTYKNKISAVFEKMHIEYEANYQDENSTKSATLYIALQDSKQRKVFWINVPEPNRKLIYLNSEISPETTPVVSPTSIPPIHLPSAISFGGTHEIIITAKWINRNKVLYIISGNYIDMSNKPQSFYREIPIEQTSVDLAIKEYTLVIGTGKQGKLKIKKFSLCDQKSLS